MEDKILQAFTGSALSMAMQQFIEDVVKNPLFADMSDAEIAKEINDALVNWVSPETFINVRLYVQIQRGAK